LTNFGGDASIGVTCKRGEVTKKDKEMVEKWQFGQTTHVVGFLRVSEIQGPKIFPLLWLVAYNSLY